jgi:hypothetical protein
MFQHRTQRESAVKKATELERLDRLKMTSLWGAKTSHNFMLVASEVLGFIAISSHLHRTISGLSAECEMSMFYIVVLERKIQ